jgi:hypothetical protein
MPHWVSLRRALHYWEFVVCQAELQAFAELKVAAATCVAAQS